jgi:Bifunctional DNA primase/polymerase, N-terminal
MIGVPTGGRMCVVDLDLQHASAREWLAANQDVLPATRTHHTRSGGQHLLFQAHPEVKSTASKIAKHVDTRGSGGYIVWWPGEGLGVENPDALADVPAFILDALKTPERDAQPAPAAGRRERKHDLREIVINNTIDSVVRTIATASEGARNSLTYWGACRLAELVYHGAIDREDAMALVVEAASRTGLPAFEARLTALSAFRRVATEGPRQ